MTDYIYTGAAAKQIDRLAIEQFGYSGFELMTLAGQRAFQNLSKKFTAPVSLLVLCGGGNNGGDGYIIAAAALEAGWKVTCLQSKQPTTDDAKAAAQRFLDAGGKISSPKADSGAGSHDVIVDALLGVGLKGAPTGEVRRLIEAANQFTGYKFAVDVPSGVDADNGAVYQPCFNADKTLTFIVPKIGLMTGPALNWVGDLELETLDIEPVVLAEVESCARPLSVPQLPARDKDSNKGNFGHVVVAGGDNGMLGAALLAGRAALRTGAGKVHILSTDEHLDWPALSTPELMSAVFEETNLSLPEEADVLALGPGLGRARWGRAVFERLIEFRKPVVIDADGITLLAESSLQSTGRNWVLTPHPGEAASLLSSSVAEVQADRRRAALAIAQQRQAVCVLKGAGTIIASPEGEVFLCALGNPGMATAGMGDVLTGVIAALLGQGLAELDAALAGVWLHAASADRVVESTGELGLLASDVIATLPGVLSRG